MKTTKHIYKVAQKICSESFRDFDYMLNELTRIKKALLNGKFYAGVVSVSRSGMCRKIKLAYVYKNELRKITDPEILKLAGVNSKGSISGCGMDMLFHAQYTLFHNLHKSYKQAHYQTRMKTYRELI